MKYQISFKSEAERNVSVTTNSADRYNDHLWPVYLLETILRLEGIDPKKIIENMSGTDDSSKRVQVVTLKEGQDIPPSVKESAEKYLFLR